MRLGPFVVFWTLLLKSKCLFFKLQISWVLYFLPWISFPLNIICMVLYRIYSTDQIYVFRLQWHVWRLTCIFRQWRRGAIFLSMQILLSTYEISKQLSIRALALLQTIMHLLCWTCYNAYPIDTSIPWRICSCSLYSGTRHIYTLKPPILQSDLCFECRIRT